MDLNENAASAERATVVELVRQIYLSQALARQIRRNDELGVQRWLRLGANPNAIGNVDVGDPMILLTVTDCFIRREKAKSPYGMFDLPLRRRKLFYVQMPGNTRIIADLIGAGADINSMRPDGSTVLMNAALYWPGDFVEFLVKHGADVNTSGTDGDTSLHAAAWMGNAPALRVLLDAGANIEAVGRYQMTPLLSSIAGSFSNPQRRLAPPCTFELIDKGSNVNHADERGNTAAHYAAGYGNPRLLAVICESGADVNARNKSRQTPLMKAAGGTDDGLSQYIHLDNVSMLVSLGADINAADDYGDTAVHLASRFGGTAIVELLLDSGARPDMQNQAGETPLIVTAKEIGRSYGRVGAGVAATLLRRGADPDIRDSAGKTAGDYLPKLFGRSMSETCDVWTAKLKIAKSRLFRR